MFPYVNTQTSTHEQLQLSSQMCLLSGINALTEMICAGSSDTSCGAGMFDVMVQIAKSS